MQEATPTPPTAAPAKSPGMARRMLRAENWGRLAWLMFRGVVGWRFGAAVLLLVGAGYVLATRSQLTAGEAHVLLGRLFAVFALILASPLLPDERSGGTLEILWMAFGSLRRLLRWKEGVLLVGTSICIIPILLVTSWYLHGSLNVLWTGIFLLTQTFLVVAWTFYVGSYLPQAWAGGLVAGAVLLAIEWPLSIRGGILNPFIQIYISDYELVPLGKFIFNRVLVVGLAWYFHDQTARRIRSWLR